MAVNRNYSTTAVETVLTGPVSSGATSFTVGSTTGHPAVPYTLVVGLNPDGTGAVEAVTVTGAAGVVLTVSRGQDGTAASAHALSAPVTHDATARDLAEPQAHIAASTSVHGLAGAVVGTTDVQTLANKTLTTPTIASFVNALHSHHNAALGGQLDQADTHQTPDTDVGLTSVHHTLGSGPTQAAPGSHSHATPVWGAFVPTWTGATSDPVLGNGTMVGRYVRAWWTVDFIIEIIAGSTTTFGSGNWSLALPVPAAANGLVTITAVYGKDSSAGKVYAGAGTIASAGTVLQIHSTGNAVTDVVWDAVTPFAWAATDFLRISGTYEAA